MRHLFAGALAGLVLAPAFAEVVAAKPLPRGELIEEVVCLHDSAQSYALYLPESFTGERSWPILYALDARTQGPGRGTGPIKLLRDTAERFGYIVASSNNSTSDYGLEVNVEAMQAMWRDTHTRFKIDDRRVYLTGMSGTARASCYLADTAPGTIAGVIACAAGFSSVRPPHEDLSFAVYGIAGNTDFNYQELQRLEETLLELEVPHRVETFDGAHGWPPPEEMLRAVEWMELRAMREERRPRDQLLIDAAFERELQRALADEQAGRVYEAFKRYRDTARDLDGLCDISRARAGEARLGGSKALREVTKRREKLRLREEAYTQRASQSLARIRPEDASRSLGRMLSYLDIGKLKKKAQGEVRDERLSAQRMLADVFVQTAFYAPIELRRRRDHRREALCLAVAAEINPERADVWYNLACARALAGERKKALKALRRAVEQGFRKLDLLESDEDLEALRGDEEFKAIVTQLSEASSS